MRGNAPKAQWAARPPRSRQESRLGKAQRLAIEQESILCTNSDLEKDRLKGKCNRQREEQPDLHVISKNKARKETDDAEEELGG
jgi:hypothetical protein